jgi:hypothetical protein
MKCHYCLAVPKKGNREWWDVDDVCPDCAHTREDARLTELLEAYVEAKAASLDAGHRVQRYLETNSERLRELLGKEAYGQAVHRS